MAVGFATELITWPDSSICLCCAPISEYVNDAPHSVHFYLCLFFFCLCYPFLSIFVHFTPVYPFLLLSASFNLRPFLRMSTRFCLCPFSPGQPAFTPAFPIFISAGPFLPMSTSFYLCQPIILFLPTHFFYLCLPVFTPVFPFIFPKVIPDRMV